MLNRTDSSTERKIKDAINRWYRKAQRIKKWKQLYDQTTVTVASGDQEFFLRPDVETLMLMWNLTADKEITIVHDEQLVRNNVGTIDTAGSPNSASYIEKLGAFVQPVIGTPERIQVFSSEAADGMDVGITGDLLGLYISDTLTLNGVTSVGNAKTYSKIRTFTKSALSAGTITLQTQSPSLTVLSQIGADEYSTSYQWMRLSKPVDVATVLNYSFKKKVPVLTRATDEPWLDCDDVLFHGAHADLLKSSRQFAQAKEAKQDALEALDDLMGEDETNVVLNQFNVGAP